MAAELTIRDIVELLSRDEVEALDFKFATLTETSIDGLLEGLKGNRSCKVLDFWSSGLNLHLADSLARGLSQNRYLVSLDFGHNTLNANGTKALCDGIKSMSVLTRLYLSEVDMRDEGCQHVAALLTGHRTLVHVELKGNEIGNAGAVALSRALEENTVLESLNLYHNVISPPGGMAIAATMERSMTLSHVNLDANLVTGHPCMERIELQSEQNTRSLKLLNRHALVKPPQSLAALRKSVDVKALAGERDAGSKRSRPAAGDQEDEVTTSARVVPIQINVREGSPVMRRKASQRRPPSPDGRSQLPARTPRRRVQRVDSDEEDETADQEGTRAGALNRTAETVTSPTHRKYRILKGKMAAGDQIETPGRSFLLSQRTRPTHRDEEEEEEEEDDDRGYRRTTAQRRAPETAAAAAAAAGPKRRLQMPRPDDRSPEASQSDEEEGYNDPRLRRLPDENARIVMTPSRARDSRRRDDNDSEDDADDMDSRPRASAAGARVILRDPSLRDARRR